MAQSEGQKSSNAERQGGGGVMDRSSARIMVVEDDVAMQSLLRDFLEMQGYQAEGFRLARTALAEIERQVQSNASPFSLVISDINMPEMNGFEFVSSARNLNPSLAVVLITAFGDSATQASAHSAGANGYLNKPFKLSDLSDVVTKLLMPAK